MTRLLLLKTIKKHIKDSLEKQRVKRHQTLLYSVERSKVDSCKDYISISYIPGDLDDIIKVDSILSKIMGELGYLESGSGYGMDGRDISFILE